MGRVPPSQAAVPLPESMLWQAQREFFRRQSIDAWRSETVPHYVTNNPALAQAYAEVVYGFLRDCEPAGADAGRSGADPSEPLYIVELGAGTGRFTYLFLKALTALCERRPVRGVGFRYVMTDVIPGNVEFYRAHPSLQRFVSGGVLDFAVFDLERDTELELLHSHTALRPGGLAHPLVVIANYVLDSVAQHAFTVRGGELFELCVSVEAESEAESESLDLTQPDVFEHLRWSYKQRPASLEYFPEPSFNRILREYSALPDGTVLLFPHLALRCLERLRALSRGRLLLLSSDKGYLDAQSAEEGSEPHIAVHGSISMHVNYHAIGAWVRALGGHVLHPSHRHLSLESAAFLLGPPPGGCPEMQLAWYREFERASWEDLFLLRKGLEVDYMRLGFEHLLAFLRLSHDDPRVLRDCAPTLIEYASALSEAQRDELTRAVQRAWENHYDIGGARDLAFEFATLVHALDRPQCALDLLRESLRLAGPHPCTSWNISLCLFALGRREEAVRTLDELWRVAPDFKPATAFLPKPAPRGE